MQTPSINGSVSKSYLHTYCVTNRRQFRIRMMQEILFNLIAETHFNELILMPMSICLQLKKFNEHEFSKTFKNSNKNLQNLFLIVTPIKKCLDY